MKGGNGGEEISLPLTRVEEDSEHLQQQAGADESTASDDDGSTLSGQALLIFSELLDSLVVDLASEVHRAAHLGLDSFDEQDLYDDFYDDDGPTRQGEDLTLGRQPVELQGAASDAALLNSEAPPFSGLNRLAHRKGGPGIGDVNTVALDGRGPPGGAFVNGHLGPAGGAPGLPVSSKYGVDIFGQTHPAVATDSFECFNCGRLTAAGRYAPHLEKCMGKGRTASRAASRNMTAQRKGQGSRVSPLPSSIAHTGMAVASAGVRTPSRTPNRTPNLTPEGSLRSGQDGGGSEESLDDELKDFTYGPTRQANSRRGAVFPSSANPTGSVQQTSSTRGAAAPAFAQGRLPASNPRPPASGPRAPRPSQATGTSRIGRRASQSNPAAPAEPDSAPEASTASPGMDAEACGAIAAGLVAGRETPGGGEGGGRARETRAGGSNRRSEGSKASGARGERGSSKRSAPDNNLGREAGGAIGGGKKREPEAGAKLQNTNWSEDELHDEQGESISWKRVRLGKDVPLLRSDGTRIGQPGRNLPWGGNHQGGASSAAAVVPPILRSGSCGLEAVRGEAMTAKAAMALVSDTNGCTLVPVGSPIGMPAKSRVGKRTAGRSAAPRDAEGGQAFTGAELHDYRSGYPTQSVAGIPWLNVHSPQYVTPAEGGDSLHRTFAECETGSGKLPVAFVSAPPHTRKSKKQVSHEDTLHVQGGTFQNVSSLSSSPCVDLPYSRNGSTQALPSGVPRPPVAIKLSALSKALYLNGSLPHVDHSNHASGQAPALSPSPSVLRSPSLHNSSQQRFRSPHDTLLLPFPPIEQRGTSLPLDVHLSAAAGDPLSCGSPTKSRRQARGTITSEHVERRKDPGGGKEG
eukprot:TRINITY_DN3672_c0_g1_i1.p1 TRINITY_DN3672_c0_g1~~TRINITY_DN3672_c0_g1_i1.p1  ORF type:complete len:860 (-),score=122.33 TRINITY_DN3672_c0_g1_i1:375-2954(-)